MTVSVAEFQSKAAAFRERAARANARHAEFLDVFMRACARYDWETARTAQEQALLHFDEYMLAQYDQFKLSESIVREYAAEDDGA